MSYFMHLQMYNALYTDSRTCTFTNLHVHVDCQDTGAAAAAVPATVREGEGAQLPRGGAARICGPHEGGRRQDGTDSFIQERKVEDQLEDEEVCMCMCREMKEMEGAKEEVGGGGRGRGREREREREGEREGERERERERESASIITLLINVVAVLIFSVYVVVVK